MWIVLDPIEDKALRSGFATDLDAFEWLARETELAMEDGDDERLKLLNRCAVAPFDPERDSK